ncbi:MAG: response regulator transcription factor [Oscillospiraceae bacterium]|jgi:two-component system alkaline phosphatase synthesis response regulator PhoP|nr:response regulator transcription factor [Oscillospiraceae bacterium]MCI8715723.1 response regulator transcription factor [Oscillospiraceae bacterium]MCI9317513.1 response regulator transcription factor [Oscillospiraceae bacterium]
MIYFVEDDNSIRKLVLYSLTSAGMEAEGFARPGEFWSALDRQIPQVVLLDIMLPEEDGISILKRLRASRKTKRLQVILLTAKGSEFDKVVGLDAGADDYVAKPFGMMELMARVRSALRRAEDAAPSVPILSLGELSVDRGRHLVRVAGEDVALTLKEFQLLCLLLERPGTVFTRDQLLSTVWGYDFDGASRTVDVHVRTLRQKLGAAGNLVQTVRGIGYKIGEAP